MVKIIKLNDDLEIEVEVDENQAHRISDNNAVDSSIEKIQPFLTKVMQPVGNTFKGLYENISIESAKVTIGIKIGIEGNFILAKSTAGANIQVEMTLRPTNA